MAHPLRPLPANKRPTVPVSPPQSKHRKAFPLSLVKKHTRQKMSASEQPAAAAASTASTAAAAAATATTEKTAPPHTTTPTLTVDLSTTMRQKNLAIDAALGPEHEDDKHESLPVPQTTGRRGSTSSQGSKKSFAESIATVGNHPRAIARDEEKVEKDGNERVVGLRVIPRLSRCPYETRLFSSYI